MDTPLVVILELLVLLTVANGAPVIATRLLGARGAWPLDGGIAMPDGRRLLGPRKTVRGLVSAMLAALVVGVIFGYPGWLGALFGVATMVGDASSSFVKRRLGVMPSGRALGLDQIPEALLPLLVCYRPLMLDPWAVVLVVGLFAAGQILLSPLMYRLGIRRQPH